MEFFIINDLQAQLKAKNVLIDKLKKHIANLKGKNVVESAATKDNSNVVTPKVYKLDLQPFSHKLLKNKEAHVDYLKHTQENVDILREIVEQARELRPLDRVSSSTKASGSKPKSNTKKDSITQTSSSNKKKNKVEDHPSEDLGKLKPKADIGIFVGYAPAKKAYRIYNKRTRKIMETIHVTFDELTVITSEQFSLRPAPQLMTHETLSSGLMPNPIPQTPYFPPIKNDWDILFQPMFDDLFNPPSSVVSPLQADVTPRPVDPAGSLIID
ncbi:hypothetical protein Tco_1003847 [Tanacetum coccineum]|uniref:Retroviral polymerase SH3-like domain-containing protein n=1 Tax=Tanacetum coccineum TaxID=301880 RepID=A0ABQ5FAV8_9ASTR